jgi:thiamine-phosphate pyrophosphorylase
LAKVAEAARSGVDYVQLREKDLASRDLEDFARLIVQRVRDASGDTRVLINSRSDLALAAGAHGVHLRSGDISSADARKIWRTAGQARKGASSEPVIAVSCHDENDVKAAKSAGANFVVFGPVFQKPGSPEVGLSALRAACAHGVPVLALGGVNAENALSCVEAGAAGIAGIRLFQKGSIAETVRRLRG